MLSKKKIALVLYKYFPYGGLQRDFLNVVKELLNRDLILKVFVGKWEGKRPKDLDILELGTGGYTNSGKNINFFRQVTPFIENFNPDLKFGFNKMPELDLYLAADTCFKFRKKSKNFIYKLLPRYKMSVNFEEAVFGNKSETKILLLNHKQEKEFISEYKTDKSRLLVIPPGLSKEWKEGNIETKVRESMGIKDDETLILFVGSDYKRKGLDRAIKAITHYTKKYSKSVYLVVVGKDDPRPFVKLVNNLGVKDRVTFLGPRNDVIDLMYSADLLIHPAREEAAGNVIIEAMVAKLPILTCEEVGFSEYVKDYNAGVVIPNPYKQVDLNIGLEKLLKGEEILLFKKNLANIRQNELFFSRYSFIGEFIEKELNV